MPDREKLDKAIESVQSLDRSVGELAKEVAATKGDVSRQKTIIRWTLASLVADIFITAAIAFGGYTIQSLQDEQRDSTNLTRDNQCALVNLFIQLEKNATTNPSLRPEERAQRIVLYKKIHEIHDNLRCPNV